jgi:hypothetical protein
MTKGVICSVGTIADHVTLARVDRGVRVTVTADGRTSTTVVTRESAAVMRDALDRALGGWE